MFLLSTFKVHLTGNDGLREAISFNNITWFLPKFSALTFPVPIPDEKKKLT